MSVDVAETNPLPVEVTDHLNLDVAEAKQYGENLHDEYVSADPFPHIAIDNFLPEALIQKILADFPARPVEEEVNFDGGYLGFHKRQIPPANCDGFSRDLFNFFNSAPILKFLEGITGIKGLIPDPYYMGGGYHEISRGGLLGVHADFRLNKNLNVQRRINMLIYLNEDWQEEWGGQLELWDKEMKHKVRGIYPFINRCVIFNTDGDSYHGHPEALNCPENVNRRSIALYYYTASDAILDEIPAHDTMYRARPTDSADIKREAAMLRVNNYIADFLPPILSRKIFNLRHRMKKGSAEKSEA